MLSLTDNQVGEQEIAHHRIPILVQQRDIKLSLDHLRFDEEAVGLDDFIIRKLKRPIGLVPVIGLS